MVLSLTKKQNDHQSIAQLYHYFTSRKSTPRDVFQTKLNQLSTKPFDIAMGLASIRDKGILNLENFSLILIHPSPFELSSGLIQLHDANLLNAENKKALERHISPTGIALVLRLLHSVNLLTSENRAAIQGKNDPHAVASILFKLYYADLFTQRNFDSVLSHPHLVAASNLLSGFNRQNSLTQTMFEQLICSQQEKNSLPDVPKELKKFAILSKHSNLSIYPCGASFFPAHKRRQDQESSTQTTESNRQICKN
ncbi:hypothetical protein [Rickettsiella endosymbiont of Miltochrista miniata]|uniref:hypothetical protein n=1 Tax=Rickettsiella endosymbiont of Miltochrista miniata TaxID=3066239 RepID=UPI00313AB5D1